MLRITQRIANVAPYLSSSSTRCHNTILLQRVRSGPFHRRTLASTSENPLESLIRTQTGLFRTLSESAPVEGLQEFLVSVHDLSGLPWWATIACCTALLRTVVTLPLAVYQYYVLAKLENLRLKMPDIVEGLKRETALAIKMYDWDERTAKATFNRSIRKHWNDMVVKENCHPFKTTLLIWFQIPMWISFSVALRNLVYMLPETDAKAQLIFTELSLGGFGFIPNLTLVDSSLILPVTLGILNLVVIEFQLASRKNEPSKVQRILTNFFRVLTVAMVPVAAFVPSCLVLYWTTSSLYGLVQNIVLVSPKFRRFCRIPKTASELENPYLQVTQRLKNKFHLPK